MMRYWAAATALKLLGSTAPTRSFYRDVLGNVVGARKRSGRGLDPSYLVRARTLLDLDRRHGLLRDGMRILEVGTGWLHFYSIFIALFHDVEATLTDIWDNRQFAPLQRAFSELERVLDASFDLTESQSRRAHDVLRGIAATHSFEELYRFLGFEYVVDPEGALGFATPSRFDLVLSFHVLEHVHRDVVEGHAARMAASLTPGGRQLHQIGIDDHLSHYDPKMSPKQYLSYSDQTWRRFFENRLQYFNRLQKSEWQALFRATGMRVLDEEVERCSLQGVSVDARFAHFDTEDLACTTLTVVLAPEGEPQS